MKSTNILICALFMSLISCNKEEKEQEWDTDEIFLAYFFKETFITTAKLEKTLESSSFEIQESFGEECKGLYFSISDLDRERIYVEYGQNPLFLSEGNELNLIEFQKKLVANEYSPTEEIRWKSIPYAEDQNAKGISFKMKNKKSGVLIITVNNRIKYLFQLKNYDEYLSAQKDGEAVTIQQVKGIYLPEILK